MSKSVIWVLFSFLFPLSQAGAQTGRRVTWTSQTKTGDTLFAKAVFEARESIQGVSAPSVNSSGEIEAAVCKFEVTRPAHGVGPMVDPRNILICVLRLTGNRSTRLMWKLGDVPVSRWGNRFYPKGFSIVGEIATKLFAAMQNLYNTEERSAYLKLSDSRFESPGGYYHIIEYGISTADETDLTGVLPMSCSKEYYYASNEALPEKPFQVSCDFIYQFTGNGEVD